MCCALTPEQTQGHISKEEGWLWGRPKHWAFKFLKTKVKENTCLASLYGTCFVSVEHFLVGQVKICKMIWVFHMGIMVYYISLIRIIRKWIQLMCYFINHTEV